VPPTVTRMPNLSEDPRPPVPKPSRDGWLNRTVLGASVTSAFGDLTYETTNVILPGFLAALGLPAAVLGTIEGIADAVSSISKLGAGFVADRLGHRKALVVVGYGLTTLMQVFFAVANGWPLVLVGRVIGWLGRGIRGPLRDAIMSEAITSETRGKAFGLHRAADTIGAVVGPLLGVTLVAWLQRFSFARSTDPFRFLFWLTLIPGVLSVACFALLVGDSRRAPNPSVRFWVTLREFPNSFRGYLVAVGAFGVGDFAHTLLILAATQLLTPTVGLATAAQIAGLLYVWRNSVQAAASFPIGALADRVGHRRVLVIGYGLGAGTAALMALAFTSMTSAWLLVLLTAVFTTAGLYVAVEEALEATLTAEYIPAATRGLGYGVLGTVNGVGDFVSSTAVGFLWTAVSPVLGFGVAAALMMIGTVMLGRLKH
jgi:MFS family permease